MCQCASASFSYFSVLGLKLWPLRMLSVCFASELHPQPMSRFCVIWQRTEVHCIFLVQPFQKCLLSCCCAPVPSAEYGGQTKRAGSLLSWGSQPASI